MVDLLRRFIIPSRGTSIKMGVQQADNTVSLVHVFPSLGLCRVRIEKMVHRMADRMADRRCRRSGNVARMGRQTRGVE